MFRRLPYLQEKLRKRRKTRCHDYGLMPGNVNKYTFLSPNRFFTLPLHTALP